MPIAGAYGQNKTPQKDGSHGGTDKQGLSSSHGVFIGTVKKNDDNQHMGRLQVYIPDFGGKPDDENNWISVSYATPFGGSTSIFEQGSNVENYDDTIKSYGFWAVPPDIDSRVLVAFAGGKLDLGYWFACLLQRGTQVSIPGLPAGRTHKGDNRPIAPKNKKDTDPDLEKYVQHDPAYNALKRQGLENDPTRGTTTSGATRESPSRVIGLLTPGQHQFVLDDGDKDGKNRLIRLRTRNGAQILMDDVSGHIYAITKDGSSWIELSNDGQIHLYGSADINIRSEKNINLRADKNVNIEAGDAINIRSERGESELVVNTNVSILTPNDTTISSGGASHISSSVAHYETAGEIHMNGPTAAITSKLDLNSLSVNQSVTNSICSTVPEHEPWAGHAGSINPVGPGNQQMKQDPAPEQTPRQPKDGESGAPINPSNQDKAESVPVSEAKTSDNAVNVIKDQNGYTPVNVEDAGGQSVGYGSELTTDNSIKPPANNNNNSTDANTDGIPDTFLSQETIDGSSSSSLTNTTDLSLKDNITRGFNTNDNSQLNSDPVQGINKSLLDQTDNAQTNITGESSNFVNKLGQTTDLNQAKDNISGYTDASLNQNNIGQVNQSINSGLTTDQAIAGLKSSNIIPGQNTVPDNISSILSQGVTPDRANQMLLNDISKNETGVKQILSGVDTIPQNAFDSLVSFHNQTGDASYAFVKGEKIDLTGLYKTGQWDRAASFIAADERDRSRRIAEATIMSSNNYGSITSEQTIISQGLNKTNELIGKGTLNQQTGNPANWQQTIAAGTSYFNQTNSMMPNLNLPTKLNILNNVNSGSVLSGLTRQAGPWPY